MGSTPIRHPSINRNVPLVEQGYENTGLQSSNKLCPLRIAQNRRTNGISGLILPGSLSGDRTAFVKRNTNTVGSSPSPGPGVIYDLF